MPLRYYAQPTAYVVTRTMSSTNSPHLQGGTFDEDDSRAGRLTYEEHMLSAKNRVPEQRQPMHTAVVQYELSRGREGGGTILAQRWDLETQGACDSPAAL